MWKDEWTGSRDTAETAGMCGCTCKKNWICRKTADGDEEACFRLFICHESGFPSDEKIVTEGKWEVNSKRNFCGIICYSSAFGRTVTASGHSKRSTIGRVPRQAGCFQPFCFRTVCAVNAQTWLSSNNNFTFLRLYLSFVWWEWYGKGQTEKKSLCSQEGKKIREKQVWSIILRSISKRNRKTGGPCQMAAGILCSREYFTGLPLAFW